MTLTRPRLIASLLCLLLALAAAFLLWSGRLTVPGAVLEPVRTFDVQGEPPPPLEPTLAEQVNDEPVAQNGPAAVSAIAVTMPRIAYTYGYSFRLDRGRIAAVQEQHLALCRRLGPARCRVTAMQRGGTADGDAGASLKLQVAASLAEGFGHNLVAIAGAGGGETVDRSIAAEDLSRQMIDSA